MMITSALRFFHSTPTCYNSSKSLLATLRKKTGYTFANCKKALELNENDLAKAEKWLHQQAQALGWSKATKLEGRITSQGLIGVMTKGNNAALVEVNCETDFVARNAVFQELVGNVTKACLQCVEGISSSNNFTKYGFNSEKIGQIHYNDKTLSDLLALTIGSVGENAVLKRACCIKAANDVLLSGYTHPSGARIDGVLLGKIGGVVGLRQLRAETNNVEDVGRNLCLHVVGMNPKRIGTESDTPSEDPDEEDCLIHQEFVMDNSITVNDILLENGVEVVDFERFECGENLENECTNSQKQQQTLTMGSMS